MNVTNLYIQLSRLVLNLETDVNSSSFDLIERQLCKLRGLLLCRVCRDLRLDPHCSSFCQHIVCGTCLKERKSYYAACKWCRNVDDLFLDSRSKTLILSYKRLCSVLEDFLEIGSSSGTGVSAEKRRLQKFLADGISAFDQSQCRTESNSVFKDTFNFEESVGSKSKPLLISKCVGTDALFKSCPTCLCEYRSGKQPVDSCAADSNFTTLPTEVTFAHSEGVNQHQNSSRSPDYVSDAVSSTVPDTCFAPVRAPELRTGTRNKYGRISQDGVANWDKEGNAGCKHDDIAVDNLADENLSTSVAKVAPENFYKSLPLSLNGRKHRTIFKEFGLPLPTPQEPSTPDGIAEVSTKRRRKNKNSEKEPTQMRASKAVEFETTCLTPLKIKMRKISNSISGSDCDASYSVETFESKPAKKTLKKFGVMKEMQQKGQPPRRRKLSLSHRNGMRNRDGLFSARLSHKCSDVTPSKPNLRQRKPQTLLQSLALSAEIDNESDISDFEASFSVRKAWKEGAQRKKREICGCGSGCHIKSLTNICRKQRCPCFRTARPCIDCNCHYCSNPYVGDLAADAGSKGNSDIQQALSTMAKDEGPDVDVEVV